MFNLDLSGEKKTKSLVKEIGDRVGTGDFEVEEKRNIQYILDETKPFINAGEWLVGFEIMVSNLDEIDFKVEVRELALMKEIFEKANVNWRKDWSWIEKMKK